MTREKLNDLGKALFHAFLVFLALFCFLLWLSANGSWETERIIIPALITIGALGLATVAGLAIVMKRIVRYDHGLLGALRETQ
ncbi:MAG: hypothetical protein V4486_03100 [Patescibacteria group bacterium]